MATTSSTTSTGSSIISAIGTGSGIDSSSLVNKLVDVYKAPETERLTTKKTLLETRISDYGLLRSAFSKLETAAAALGSADTFNAKSASIPDTSLIGVTKLDASASIGEYAINVDAIAKSQSISSGNFASQTAPIGKGTIAIRFGVWNDAATSFTVDSTKTGGTITIDDSNNSLVGLKDSINKSNLGLKASILNIGGQYKLMVTAPSGASQEIELTATETPGSPGLASFNFNSTTRNFSQQQGGEDAVVRINGMSVTRSTNHLTDVIEGVEFDLFNKSATETVSMGITEDKSLAEKAIRDFVAAYNTFLSETDKLVGFDKEKNAYGSLKQDPLAKNLLQQVRSQFGAPIVGLSGKFSSLSDIGVRTKLDGTLEVDDSDNTTSFKSSFANNFEAIRDLFVSTRNSSSAQIAVTKNSAKSVAGNYAVNITTQASQGTLFGSAVGITFPYDTTGKALSFTVSVDGTESNTITLPTKTYNTAAELAIDLQSLINVDSKLSDAKASLSVSYNSTLSRFEFTSNTFGSSSKISFASVGADMGDLGLSVASGTIGTDVAGTIDGVAGFGYGKVLLPALGSKAEGLSMTVEPGATSATISFSRGFSGTFTSLIDDFLSSSGMIKTRETAISKDQDKVKTDQSTLDRRAESYRARLQAQFSAMESIVRSLKSTGSFLTGAFKALSASSSDS